ncbi:hypothetical protein Tco_1330210 [Tanacetum coccineum]
MSFGKICDAGSAFGGYCVGLVAGRSWASRGSPDVIPKCVGGVYWDWQFYWGLWVWGSSVVGVGHAERMLGAVGVPGCSTMRRAGAGVGWGTLGAVATGRRGNNRCRYGWAEERGLRGNWDKRGCCGVVEARGRWGGGGRGAVTEVGVLAGAHANAWLPAVAIERAIRRRGGVSVVVGLEGLFGWGMWRFGVLVFVYEFYGAVCLVCGRDIRIRFFVGLANLSCMLVAGFVDCAEEMSSKSK